MEQFEKVGKIVGILEQGSILLHLDPRGKDVIVPEELKQESSVVLRIGYNLKPQIPDISITDEHISATLHFNNQPFHCVLPYESISNVHGDIDIDIDIDDDDDEDGNDAEDEDVDVLFNEIRSSMDHASTASERIKAAFKELDDYDKTYIVASIAAGLLDKGTFSAFE